MRNIYVISAIVAFATAADAQTPTGKPLTFDAASVKPAAPLGEGTPTADGRIVTKKSVNKKGGQPSGGPGTSDPGRIYYPWMSLKQLLMKAYDVENHQIVGPGWLPTERFDIVATMPPDTTQKQLRIMLQNLLADRFRVTFHRETKQLPIFALVVAKNGPKLKESADIPAPKEGGVPRPAGPVKLGPDGFPESPDLAGRVGIFFAGGGAARFRVIFQYQTMLDLAEELPTRSLPGFGPLLSRPVKDETGLKGRYDFTLTFGPEGTLGATASSQPATDPLPDIYVAIQSQLGLKLEPKNGPVELIVVDHAERTPTGN